ncbi:MAG: hypothetical protein U1G07_15475 [Verrucomicrobiota bacterium]
MRLPQSWLWSRRATSALIAFVFLFHPPLGHAATPPPAEGPEHAQVPAWSNDDLQFFLHGSMSTEVVPEAILRTFIKIYPDLYPKPDLSHLGLLPDQGFGWPVGFSRKEVNHLGGLMSVGINCAACHVGEVTSADGKQRVRVLGMTSHFDAEGFFGALLGATFRTADPDNMKKFMAAYLTENDPEHAAAAQDRFFAEWERQEPKIIDALKAAATGGKKATRN